MPNPEPPPFDPAASDPLAEAERLMTVCNSCRYCEGLCAVFPAMELRLTFIKGDLNYLANLCHGCGACYDDCQFAPPHEFAVNVPLTLAQLRVQSYARYAWPAPLAAAFRWNGLLVTLVVVVSVAAFLAAFADRSDPHVMFDRQTGVGAFYRVMPHAVMALMFGAALLFSAVALAMGARAFLQDPISLETRASNTSSLWEAVRDAGRLRYLDGGGVGCVNGDEEPDDHRRVFHHLVFYGFMLCFASTAVATVYHYLLHREAPYPLYDLPVLLGAAGGVGLLVGGAGLLVEKVKRRAELKDGEQVGMDLAFILLLALAGATGLGLLVLRDTAAMGTLLAVHLGVIFALFITVPYGKAVHGLYRLLALIRYTAEMRAGAAGKPTGAG